jgi:hypothetical protein
MLSNQSTVIDVVAGMNILGLDERSSALCGFVNQVSRLRLQILLFKFGLICTTDDNSLWFDKLSSSKIALSIRFKVRSQSYALMGFRS